MLARYLTIDTTNPPGHEIRAANFLKGIFDREGIEARAFESAPGRGNIYARLRGEGSRKAVVLLNHLGVVAADKRFWAVDPFAGTIKDGYVWGRGTLDMKGMAILELMTMLMLKRQGASLKGDVIFLGTADEQADGRMGAGFITRDHWDLVKDAGAVLNEGGWISVRDGGLVYAVGVSQKTPLRLTLTAIGSPGHGSVPRPNSAVHHLIRALHRLLAYDPPVTVLPEVQSYFASTAHLEPPPWRDRFRNLTAALQDPAVAEEFRRVHVLGNAQVKNTISVTPCSRAPAGTTSSRPKRRRRWTPGCCQVKTRRRSSRRSAG